MNTAANIFLLIAGILFLFDVFLIISKRPNPVNKSWPLPCPRQDKGPFLFSPGKFIICCHTLIKLSRCPADRV